MDLTGNKISPIPPDEESNELPDFLSQFDQLTGFQMKEMEVKKIEDEITIKRLEKECKERQKGLTYSMKKLNEFRKERINTTESIKHCVLATQAYVKKVDELKRFHNEVFLISFDNAEKKAAKDKKKITELTSTFEAITARDNHVNSLNEKLEYNANEVNSNIARQIDQKNEEFIKHREKLTNTRTRIETLKKELNQQKLNNNLTTLIEKKGTRIIELEAETGQLQKQLKEELDALLQDKNKLIQEKANNEKDIQENDELISTLESEIETSEQNKSNLKENVEKSETEKGELLKQVAKDREGVELSKKAVTEKNEHIERELVKIKIEKENLTYNFTIAEESLQAELKKLHDELELKKSLSQDLEESQKHLRKLRENKLGNKQSVSNSILEGKLKKAKDNLKTHQEILLNFTKKKNNLELKIKELEQKKVQVNKNVESSTKKNEETVGDKQIEMATKLNTTKNEEIKKVQPPPRSPVIDSIYSFKLSDSDESEDEFKIKDQTPKNTRLEYSPITQKKSLFQSDDKEQSTVNTDISSSQRGLFDNVFPKSSQDQQVTKTENTTGIFKLPQPISQYRRKTPQPNKKN